MSDEVSLNDSGFIVSIAFIICVSLFYDNLRLSGVLSRTVSAPSRRSKKLCFSQ